MLATLATFEIVLARSSLAIVTRFARSVRGCQFAVCLFVCLCLVFNGVRVFLCVVFVPSASLAFYVCRVFCVRAPPWLAVRGSRRGCASLRSASLCGNSRAPRRVNRARARSHAPALRCRLLCAPAPALPARSLCLSAFRWCVHLWGAPRAALRCGECLGCAVRLLRFRCVCWLCVLLPRALFIRASRGQFAVVSSRLSVRGQFAVVLVDFPPLSLIFP